MIVDMKKYTFLIYHKDYDDFLEQISSLGVLHVIQKKDEYPENVRKQINLIKRTDSVIKILKRHLPDDTDPAEKIKKTDPFELIKKVENLIQDIDQNQQKLHHLNKEYHNQKVWGDFSVDTVNKMKKNGIKLRLFTVPVKSFDEKWKDQYPLEIISAARGNINFVILSYGEDIDIKADEIKMFDRSLSEVVDDISECKQKIRSDNSKISDFAVQYLATLKDFRDSLESEKIYFTVKHQAQPEVEDKMLVLEGWIPVTKIKNAKDYLERNNIYYLEREPEEEDIPKVPILLHNGKYAKMFEPIAKLFSLPAYNELDLTVFFAPFFMLFFGFCLGDAGYGVVLILAGMIRKIKLKDDMRPILTLIQLLGSTTILMGIVSGTLFGINLNVVDWKFNDLFLDSNSMFWLALGLGVVQILFGMCIKAANQIIQKGWLYSISTFGWMLLVISLVGMSIKAVLGYLKVDPQVIASLDYLDAVSALAGKTALIGVGMILLFNDPKANIFMRILKGMWQLYDITGLFGDVLSYIRLFALGVSGAILGLVVNNIAVEFLEIPYIGWLIFIVFLIIGHTGNILISGLGSLVHPMRLTFVEFYKNCGWTGGGKEYTPFKKRV
ncbi:MAG: V-type ATPase 116kDa subunit family protein [Candidatus Delongbacteria bacterium]